MHTYVLLIENERPIRRILVRGSLFGILREITFAPLPHIARGNEEARAREDAEDARVVANLRNEAIARVVPSVRRAYARSLAVSTRDACQDGENKEMRESLESLLLLENDL